MQRIGALRVLRRYPVKSMAGEDLDRAFVAYGGLIGDRAYAFVDNNNHSDFPWMTGRQGREMILYKPRFLDLPAATTDRVPNDRVPNDRFAAEVTSPEGEKFAVNDGALKDHLEKRFGRSLSFRFSERAMTDALPVSIFGLHTLRALSSETGMDLDHRRFRANFYADWDNAQPFYEDSLVGKTLRIGDKLTVHIVKKDSRCVMITLDPDTAESSPEVFRHVSQAHEGCSGVYGAVLREGTVAVNDPLYLV